MLSPSQLQRYYDDLNLTPRAIDWIDSIRGAPPSRPVTGRRSMTVQYASRLMGFTVDLESNGVELPGWLGYEYVEKDVLEAWSQPRPITLEYKSKSGRRVVAQHTPDTFVLREGRLGYEEWKHAEELLRLSAESPERYVREDNGVWRCPPGEAAVKPLGFYYRLRSSEEINWKVQTAIHLLEDYWLPDCPSVDDGTRNYLVELVQTNQGTTLARLQTLASKASPEDILKLIASGALYVDLFAYPLDQEYRVPVFTDKQTADAYAVALKVRSPAIHNPCRVQIIPGVRFMWDKREWMILNPGHEKIAVRPMDDFPETAIQAHCPPVVNLTYEEFDAYLQEGLIEGFSARDEKGSSEDEIPDILTRAGPEDLDRALERYASILPILEGESDNAARVSSSQYRWLHKYKEAQHSHGNGFYGLLDNYGNCGWHRETYSEEELTFAEEFIKTHYEDVTQPTRQAVLRDYRLACERAGIRQLGEKRFLKMIRDRSGPQQTRKRAGHKAAQQEEPWYLYLDYRTPKHGVRPFQIVHVDHTQLDDELVHSETGRNMGRPWLTTVMDAFTRRILVIYLTYDPPSYRTLMVVIRLLVKRYGRVPKYIVCDHGKDFDSVYFKSLMAILHISIKSRSKPREGSVIESYFKVTNREFVHNLKANTQIMKRVREVTKLVDPANHAIWFLEAMYVALEMWAYEIYDTLEHGALGESPREAFNRTLHSRGEREHTLIRYDENFLWLTLPGTRQNEHKIIPGRGIKVNYLYYMCDEMRDWRVVQQKVPVRYDPFNIGIAYAYINKRWVRCFSEHYGQLQGHSERELNLITEELHRRHKVHRQRQAINGYQIALFLESVTEHEMLLEQRMRDLESHPMRVAVESLDVWAPYTQALPAGGDAENPASPVPPGTHDASGAPDLTEPEDSDEFCPIEYMDWKD